MRFLFVYQDYGDQARNLLAELGVRDVEVIIARKGAVGPTDEEMLAIKSVEGAQAAACELNRKYRKAVDQFVEFTCEPKKFRFGDQQLREWLVPVNNPPVIFGLPSEAFKAAAERVPELILHDDALLLADQISQHRWPFATLSADLLARFASGEQLGPRRGWKADYGVEFAGNGRVSYRYVGTCGEPGCSGRTEWHLKEGDNTTRESAARIYFARVDHASGPRVVVLYVGPHPEDGASALSLKLD